MNTPAKIQTASSTGKAGTNGRGVRKCPSWIDSFVAETENLEAPEIFRKWAAIATIAAVLEQKVWLQTSSPIYPNLYVALIGHPGTGKTRTIRAARAYPMELPEFHFAPTSMTSASLVDALVAAKRMIVRIPDPPLEYNSMFIAADELGTFVHKYEEDMIAVLSSFYDPDPYGQNRRGKDIKIKIKSPQLNLLAGSTPTNLLNFMPENAWDQGFTSRMIFVFSDERIVGDDFAPKETKTFSQDLLHDIKLINILTGPFLVTDDFRNAVNNWRALGEPPVPNHPKLIHYNTRRRVHLYKLAMVSAASVSGELLLTKDDFNRALGWLTEVEFHMPEIFKAGAVGADGRAMEEIHHFVMSMDALNKGVSERLIINFASKKIPAHSVLRVLDLMERSGLLRAVSLDTKTGLRRYQALRPDAE